MEIKVDAPCNATCKAVFVNIGDILEAGSWMATLAPS